MLAPHDLLAEQLVLRNDLGSANQPVADGRRSGNAESNRFGLVILKSACRNETSPHDRERVSRLQQTQAVSESEDGQIGIIE